VFLHNILLYIHIYIYSCSKNRYLAPPGDPQGLLGLGDGFFFLGFGSSTFFTLIRSSLWRFFSLLNEFFGFLFGFKIVLTKVIKL